MIYRLYLDTSVFGALFDDEDPARVRATGLFRKGSRMDARHLAVATAAGMDALVSWNYLDMVNLGRKRVVHSVNIRHGYHMIDIVSPLEVPDVQE